MSKYKGKYIIFEGSEGSGKSTQIKLLTKWLLDLKFKVEVVREPGSTDLGEELREILLDKENLALTGKSEFLILSTARAQLIEKIKLMLKKGTIVISDRSRHSSMAYQGYGRGLDLKKIKYISDFATDEMKGDIVLLLDLDVKKGILRKKQSELRGEKLNRMDKEKTEFYQKVRMGYLKIAKNDKKLWRIINAEDKIENIHEKIKENIAKILKIKVKK